MEEDSVEEVISHLPVKSLVRCKTLSRKWQSFISGNSHFRNKYLSTGKEPSLLLGFFFSKIRAFDVVDRVRFLPTTTEGRRSMSVKKRKREADDNVQSVPLTVDDPSLSFLGHESLHLAGSSNGFLLTSVEQFHPQTYFLYNPINKPWVTLPTPNATSKFVGHGFVYSTYSPCLDKTDHYTVARVISDRTRVFGVNLSLEILSSTSPSHWKLFNFTCPFSFYPNLDYVSTTVIDKQGVIYIQAVFGKQDGSDDICLLIFEQSKKEECLQLMEFPPTEKDVCRTVYFGQSNELLLYVQHERHLGLNMWVLTDTREWSLRHKVNIEFTMERFPEIIEYLEDGADFQFISFHPTNPQILFLWIGEMLVLSDLDNSMLELLYDFDAQGWRLGYYMFPYTYGLRDHHLFFDS